MDDDSVKSRSVLAGFSVSELAGAMMRVDGLMLLTLWIVILSAGGLLLNAAPEVGAEIKFIVATLDRLVQLVFIAQVARRWHARIYPIAPQLRFTARYFLFGLALTGMWISAALFTSVGGIALLGILALGWFTVRSLLYPIPLLSPSLDIHTASRVIMALSLRQTSIVSTLILPPAVVGAALLGLIFAPYPDGRLSWTMPAAQVVSSVFSILLTYICVAASLRVLSDAMPQVGVAAPDALFGLEPKRRSSYLATLLSPARAWLLLGVNLLLWGGNMARYAILEPAAKITIVSALANGNDVELKLSATDAEYKLRGFDPTAFYLAGENRSSVSTGIKSSQEDKVGQDTEQVTLIFTTERPAESLVELTDLYLWYRGARIAPLKLVQGMTNSKQ